MVTGSLCKGNGAREGGSEERKEQSFVCSTGMPILPSCLEFLCLHWLQLGDLMTCLVSHYITLFWYFFPPISGCLVENLSLFRCLGSCVPPKCSVFGFLPSGNSVSGVSVSEASSSSNFFVKQDF